MAQEKYINPFTDFGFKKLFGSEFNKELLIDFLNQVLGEREQVQDLTYLNTAPRGQITWVVLRLIGKLSLIFTMKTRKVKNLS